MTKMKSNSNKRYFRVEFSYIERVKGTSILEAESKTAAEALIKKEYESLEDFAISRTDEVDEAAKRELDQMHTRRFN